MEVRVQPMTQKERDRRRAYLKKRRQQEIRRKIICFVVLVVGISLGVFCVKKFGSSKDRASLDKYYGIKSENQLAIIIDNEVVGAKGLLEGNTPYIEYTVVRDYLNERFYVDMKENLLLYTLPQGTVEAEVGSREYTLQKEVKTKDYPILRMDGEAAYIALSFVQEYTNLDFSLYENPNRVMIVSKWGETNVSTVKRDTQVRIAGSNKSKILADIAMKDEVTVIESKGKWKKVCTEDGFVGYVKSSCLKKAKVKTLSRNFNEQIYPNISRDYTINMAWHVVDSSSAGASVLEAIANTQGLTTISPTWFTVKDVNGNLRSYASSKYVNYAHQVNMEVWAMLRDIDGGIGTQEETYQLLSGTTNRKRLISQVMSEVLKNDIDGINVGFENISKECGEHYLQFLRELSVKCRQNEIVLSVNNPVSSSDSEQYHLEEQGKVVDYVIIKGYDEYHKDSYESGPVASLSFVENGIKNALKVVPKQKLINAVSFYAKLWKEVPKTEEELKAQEGTEEGKYLFHVTCLNYGMDKLYIPIANGGGRVSFDEKTGLNYAEWEADGATYKMWLEDEHSMEAKLELMKEYDLAGISAWRLGFEKSSVWELILKYVN